MIKCFLVILVACVVTAQAHGDLNSSFNNLNEIDKGPFGLNYLQGTTGRSSVQSGASAPGNFLFQAAYRNDDARKMIADFNFYTGNLFSTNYYELMGEYVYDDIYGSHDLDHQALINNSSAAMQKAQTMVMNWVLEKYFLEVYPDTVFAKSFAYRGIAGSEFEQEYANYFFNFYLKSLNSDYQYLPAYLLAKESPISDSKELSDARRLIAESYDYFVTVLDPASKSLKDLRNIRNNIHNQLSEDVISKISVFLKDNPWYEAQGHTYLQKINVLLKKYYAFGPKELLLLAEKANMSDLIVAAQNIIDNGVSGQSLLQLSEAVASYKNQITNDAVVFANQKAITISLVAKSCQFINKEINRMESINSVDTMLALLNTIFSEGFLIYDNWIYFHETIKSGSVADAKSLMTDIIDISAATLQESFSPAFEQWVSVAPDSKFENFMDNTMKSSSLNTASIVVSK